MCRLALAESLIELDHTGSALPLLEASAPWQGLEARRLSDLAMIQYRRGQYELARQSTGAAARLGPAASPETLAKINILEGMLQTKAGQMQSAETSFRDALTTVEGSDSLMEAYALSDLGFLKLQRFQYDEALYWLARAKDLAARNGLRRAEELATGNIGAAYSSLGDFERAAGSLTSAAHLADILRDHYYQILWLTVLGETWEESGDVVKAEASYRNAQALADPERDKEWLSNVFHDLAGLALRRGDLTSAGQMNAQSAAMARQSQSSPALLSAQVQSAAIAVARHDYTKAETVYGQALSSSLRAHDPENAFESHAGLSALYRQTGATAKAGYEFHAALAASDELDSTLQDESKFSFLSGLVQFYRDYVDFLIDRGDGDGAFRIAESSRARVLQEKLHGAGRMRSAESQVLEREARDSGAILLSYWLAPRRSTLWVIDGTGLHTFPLPPESEIAAQVDSYNSAIQRGDDPAHTGNEAGRWLFANLLGAHYHLPENSYVVIEADGALHRLNFETLPAGDDGHYWIHDATISVAPSLALLERSRYTPGGRLLAFGDPGYDGTEFQHLTNLQAELQAVENHFPDRQVYVSSQATPAAYRTSHPEAFSTLHFAAHAVANRESPLDSAIVLAGTPDRRKLYAREILGHPLTAELVTLSACQTAGSRTYYGEGLTGFSWAFLSAGARNVVAGLWDVDDRATTALMKGFYDELSSGPSPVSALRSAKLRLIAAGGVYRKPRYWAAFECFTRALY